TARQAPRAGHVGSAEPGIDQDKSDVGLDSQAMAHQATALPRRHSVAKKPPGERAQGAALEARNTHGRHIIARASLSSCRRTPHSSPPPQTRRSQVNMIDQMGCRQLLLASLFPIAACSLMPGARGSEPATFADLAPAETNDLSRVADVPDGGSA